jgi:DNA-binding beta-propeller fold protein YncE
MKGMFFSLAVSFFLMLSQTLFAGSGPLFRVSAFGTNTPADVSITLCLNAKGPVSCQVYMVSALNFRIFTTIPNHLYLLAGIKINTPGYTLGADCIPAGNGYCMFSVSDTTSKVISLNTSAQHYAYVTNSGNHTVSWCSIESAGTLSGCTSLGGFNSPSSIALNLRLAWAYITNFLGSSVFLCTIDRTTGALSTCISTGSGFSNPRAIALNPAKTFAYITQDNMVQQCSINSATGILSGCSDSGGTGFTNASGIAINPAGTFAYVTGAPDLVSRCIVNSTSGSLSGCVSTGTGFSDPARITLNAEGTFAYVTNSGTSDITVCSVDNSTGDLGNCTITAAGVFNIFGNMAINESGSMAYVPNMNSNFVSVCSVNSDGTLTACIDSGGTGFNSPQGLALG